MSNAQGKSRFDQPSILLPAAQIRGAVAELGKQITHYAFEHKLQDLLVLGVLRGAFIFMADLVREINYPLSVDFVIVESYQGKMSSGGVLWGYRPQSDLEGRDVLLVEDIVETGRTLHDVCAYLRTFSPRSLEVCTLLHKRISSSILRPIRWVGFDIEDKFVVGYGMDLDGQYRHLPYIGWVK
ncbi:hypothetical protein LCGC14_3058660 [marine sediment metagenome]|uniref:hypoxanthine phosphoribosyltransferase n=1 Tax=marine sediment metagenome TaxID=412755 RepID=A0A0F8YSD5_9ZZZZ